jgi:hypothetical protein
VTLFSSLKPVLLSRALFLTSLAITYVAKRRFIRGGGGETRFGGEEKVKPVSSLRRLLNR